jgi:vitamin B12 transporter
MWHFITLPRLGASSLLLVPALAAVAVHAGDRLDPIVVTATRAPQTVDETLSSVTVIEREEIERLQPKQFTDLLRGRAGINVADNGPFGKASSVFMRGSNAGHTLLLVDGVRMGSATLGLASWQFLPPSEIERIEIVRGPRTSIYGSDAIGGVIQVFTRKGLEGPPRVNAFIGGGSFNTREFGAGVAGGTRDTRYSLSASRFDTDGIDVLTGIGDDDRDGYDNTSLSGSLSHRLDNGVELFGNLLHSRGTTEFDADEELYDFGPPFTVTVVGPYTPAENDFVHSALRVGVRGFVTPRWQSQLALAQSRDELDSFEGGTLADRVWHFDTRRDLFDWQNTVQLPQNWTLVAGIDGYEDHVDASETFAEDSRYNVGVYSVLQGAVGHHDLEASLRFDDNEQFGSQTTGQLGWGRQLSDTWRVRASAGTAFNAPSFNQLYYPFYGNPDLDPEKSRSIEVGARFASGPVFLDTSLFHTQIDDLIDFAPQNINEARIRGLEMEAGYQATTWLTRASVTLLDAEDRESGNELPRRSPFSARVDVDRMLGDWSLGGSLLGQGRSFNDTANVDRLSGFATVDLRATYAIDREWTLEASVRNLFDRDYVTARDFTGVDYNQPGRGAFVTVRYQQQ